MSSIEAVKKLREKTGAGIVEVKKALEEAAGDEEKAITLLKKRGEAKALKRTDREAHEGIVTTYVHSNARVGVMLTLLCETDFVARNDDFKELGRDLAMHIAAMAPLYVTPEAVPAELVAKERLIWEEQVKAEGKPAEIAERILAGKEKKFREDLALVSQAFVKDPSKTVGELITESIHKIGEKIQVGTFVRYEI
ncbi:MAG: elongation factor Ts [Candidatus Moraniibacteriota bacterium]|nr:MAG: elongation factor Ts [Candidatus Moranbacteria bacterium]